MQAIVIDLSIGIASFILNWNWIDNYVIIRIDLGQSIDLGASAVSLRADDWRNKALLVHAQRDGVCECVLYSVGLQPGAKLH